MLFWHKIKQAIRSYMAGRYGSDTLNRTLLRLGIVLYLLGALLRLNALLLPGLAAYITCAFRMFSRNRAKRSAEERRYLAWKNRRNKQWKQAKARFRNRKEFTYFKCPGCRAWLKLPRGAGVVTVTCGRCQNSFTQKG
ncbi:MAG: hypothetical protein FWF86_00875 [Clostridia bacterium]|nr:hypothetical protein [Clostridia bacterium]